MPDATPVSRLRFAMLVTIGVYPLITAISYIVGPLTMGWEIWQRNLVVVPIMALTIVYGLIPVIHLRFPRFLRPGT